MISSIEEKEALKALRKEILAKRKRNKKYTISEIKILFGITDDTPRNRKHPLANIIIPDKEILFTVKAAELQIKRHIKVSGKDNFEYKKVKPYVEGILNSIEAREGMKEDAR